MPEPVGTIRTTSATTLAVAGALGFVAGAAVRPLVDRAGGIPPTVPWSAVVTLLFLAAVLGALAWGTYRTLHVRQEPVEPSRGVALLVLAKASAVAGALVAGAYLGFGLSFVESWEVALPRQRVVRSAVAMLSAVAVVVAALLLERACRVPIDPEDELAT
ncbi:MAG TPA: DUF3180 domain-containing protein [Nocardioidaceae bacterium]|nr:DUF3180 domain-containing protein [Nocardioidaceae bacterium]